MTDSRSESIDTEELCGACGTPGKHLVSYSCPIQGETSFLTCPHMYDETGKRKPEFMTDSPVKSLETIFNSIFK